MWTVPSLPGWCPRCCEPGALKTLQDEVSDWFDFDVRLDLGQNSRFEPLLEAHRAERNVTAGDARPKAKLVTAPTGGLALVLLPT